MTEHVESSANTRNEGTIIKLIEHFSILWLGLSQQCFNKKWQNMTISRE